MDIYQDINQNIDIKKILKDSFRTYGSHFPTLITIGLMYGFLMAFEGIFLKLSFGVYLVSTMLLSNWISLALLEVAVHINKGKSISIQDAFLSAKGRFIRYVTVSTAYVALCFFGLVFFVFPGVFIATIFIFASMMVVMENAGFVDAFRFSTDLVRGSFWKVFSFNFVVMCIFLLPLMIFQEILKDNLGLLRTLHIVITVIYIPFFTVALVKLYSIMRQLKPKVIETDAV